LEKITKEAMNSQKNPAKHADVSPKIGKRMAVFQPLTYSLPNYTSFFKKDDQIGCFGAIHGIPPLPPWCATSLQSGSVVGDDLKNMEFSSDVKNGAPEISPNEKWMS